MSDEAGVSYASVTGRAVIGAAVLGSQEPLARALTGAGFTMTPQGLRLRPGGRG